MSTTPEHNIFPVVYGNEEETSMCYVRQEDAALQAGLPEEAGGPADGPYEPFAEEGRSVPDWVLEQMIAAYRNNRERGVRSSGPENTGKLDSTGGGMYIDGSHLELNTPVYRTIAELCLRLEGNEVLISDVVWDYLQGSPGAAEVAGIEINLRNIDSEGHAFGVHDNLGYRFTGEPADFRLRLRAMMIAHSVTRPFVSGVGYVGRDGLYFSQRMADLCRSPADRDLGYYLYNVKFHDATGRAEVRSNDRNILRRPLRRRIGSSAMALALAQTPLAEKFRWMTDEVAIFSRKAGIACNQFQLRPDGTIVPTQALHDAVGFQRQLGETFAEHIHRYGDPPQELLDEAAGLVAYSDTMGSVLAGERTIAALREESDWAEKCTLIQRRIERDRAQGLTRDILDWRAQRDDLGYGLIRIVRGAGGLELQKLGYGFRLRDRYARPGDPTRADVIHAAYNPPEDTRSGLQGRLLREYVVHDANWQWMIIESMERGKARPGVSLPDPLTTELSPAQQKELRRARRRQPHESRGPQE